jgi:hypothetical protein
MAIAETIADAAAHEDPRAIPDASHGRLKNGGHFIHCQ